MNPKTTTRPPEDPPTFGGPQKIYISLTIFGILTVLLIVLIICPFLKEIKKISEKLLLQKNNLISFSEEIKNLQISKNLYATNQSNLEKIDELFVDPEIPIGFINFLEKNASDSQLSIEISPAATVKKETDPWPNLALQISAAGSFPNFLKFLEKLENGPFLIEVLNLNLKRVAEKEIKGGILPSNINALFLIKVFTK